MRSCGTCSKHVGITELLECTKCNGNYHYLCVNITRAQFVNKLQDLHRLWLCPECTKIAKLIKRDDNSVKISQLPFDETTMSTDEHIIEDHSIMGDTLNRDSIQTNPNQTSPQHATTLKTTGTPTLEQIAILLDEKLQTNTNYLTGYIMSEMTTLKSYVQQEITSAINNIKTEMENNARNIKSEQNNLKIELKKVNDKINILQKEKETLQNQVISLEKSIMSTKTENNNNSAACNHDITKKLVLYGLEEDNQECEQDLHDRIIYIFQDVLNINLLGYIEETRRIGKKGNRRPIIIELISKKMTKYILQHSTHFKNTGISISRMLDDTAIRKRKQLREILHEHRKQGRHAVIRDNRLLIDGKEFLLQQRHHEEQETHEDLRDPNRSSRQEDQTTLFRASNTNTFRR